VNSLSWMIYLAEVSGNVASASMFFGVALGVALTFYVIASGINESIDNTNHGRWKKALRWYWLVGGMVLVAGIIPSRQTVYMIAASEAAGYVVATPQAKEMLGDLQRIIKSELEEQASSEKK